LRLQSNPWENTATGKTLNAFEELVWRVLPFCKMNREVNQVSDFIVFFFVFCRRNNVIDFSRMSNISLFISAQPLVCFAFGWFVFALPFIFNLKSKKSRLHLKFYNNLKSRAIQDFLVYLGSFFNIATNPLTERLRFLIHFLRHTFTKHQSVNSFANGDTVDWWRTSLCCWEAIFAWTWPGASGTSK